MVDTGPPPLPDDGLAVGGAQYPPGPPERWPTWVPSLPVPPGSAGGPLPSPGGGGSGERRTAAMAAAAAAVVLLLVVGAVAWITAGGDDEQVADASPSTSPATTAPAVPSAPIPTPPSIPGLDPSDPGAPLDDARPLEEVLPGLISFVEETRGHRFRTEPVVEPLDEDAFLARFRAATEGSEAEVRDAGVALRALGILEPDSDPVAIQDDLGEQGVLGFYDPETEELVVRGAEVTPYVEIIIVHELTHALDDQYFDLRRADVLAEQPDESGFGFLSLTEGTARWVQVAYEEQLGPDELLSAQIEALTSQLGGATDPQSATLPIPFGVAIQLPYGNGAELVDALVDGGGTAAVDAAFRAPPVTSEQVLDPDRFAAGEAPVEVAAPAADGAVVDEGAIGAVDLRVLEVVTDPTLVASLVDQSAPVSPSVAVDPLAGFGGGRYVAWEEGGQACIRFTVVGDTIGGASAIADIVEGWSAEVGGVDLVPTDGGAGGLIATRCV